MYAPARRTPYVEWQLPRRDARLIEAQFSQAPPLGNVSSIPVLRLRRAQATVFIEGHRLANDGLEIISGYHVSGTSEPRGTRA